jgi:hypothetical protein
MVAATNESARVYIVRDRGSADYNIKNRDLEDDIV